MANLDATRFFDVCTAQDYFNAKYDDTLTMKIGTATLHRAEVQWLHENGQYLLTSTSVYQIHYSVNAGYHYSRLHYMKGANYCKRGRFATGDADFINKILGFDLVA